jgi:hypothetical protein
MDGWWPDLLDRLMWTVSRFSSDGWVSVRVRLRSVGETWRFYHSDAWLGLDCEECKIEEMHVGLWLVLRYTYMYVELS